MAALTDLADCTIDRSLARLRDDLLPDSSLLPLLLIRLALVPLSPFEDSFLGFRPPSKLASSLFGKPVLLSLSTPTSPSFLTASEASSSSFPDPVVEMNRTGFVGESIF
ncbi:hypothetical protein QM259_18170 [Acinetobacter baumannii]|nr:hypothetical protein [Acinetobacter baumannii]MDI9734154.1 hypothetical protein [Acinetobacter baumannii]